MSKIRTSKYVRGKLSDFRPLCQRILLAYVLLQPSELLVLSFP